ncbi:TerD family protein [Nocardioides sp. URHA0032]|uniref:TerD family protein n=1 Tax=Nocardioides sp. URHA0032 TaxID=1380388 RepID=UPI001E532E26|nr:TerD family protein [Nocardioides sp. URHA0032]
MITSEDQPTAPVEQQHADVGVNRGAVSSRLSRMTITPRRSGTETSHPLQFAGRRPSWRLESRWKSPVDGSLPRPVQRSLREQLERQIRVSVSLSKGQAVSLVKKGGATLTHVRMGLGWDAVKKRGLFGGLKSQSIDLDASAVVYDARGNVLDQVWFQQLTSKDGAIEHSGDNLTGDGDGDDESIAVRLDRLPAQVHSIVFLVNSFTGQNFSQIENAFCRLVDEQTGDEIARYELTGSGPHTAQVMAKVARTGDGWAMTALGAIANGRTFKDLLPAITPHL